MESPPAAEEPAVVTVGEPEPAPEQVAEATAPGYRIKPCKDCGNRRKLTINDLCEECDLRIKIKIEKIRERVRTEKKGKK